MTTPRVTAAILTPELQLTASRSSGPGGQNVNKVNSKITLRFDIRNSVLLTNEEKEILLRKLATRLSADGVLILTAQDKRSQLQNRDEVLIKLDQVLIKAFQQKKARKATKPSKSANRQRIQKKKQHSEKKKWRQKPE